MSSSSRATPWQIRRFLDATGGTSAVEFALVLPVLLLILLGGYEYSRVLAVSRKVTLTTRAVDDLATHYSTMVPTDISNVMNASAQIFAPYSSTNMGIVLSEIAIDAGGVATVAWSCSLNATAQTVGQPVTLPSGIGQPGTYLIWCNVNYLYVPTVNYTLNTNISLSDHLYMSPRISPNITLPSGC